MEGSSTLLSMIVQYSVVILVLSQEEIERTYFYSAILNWKPCFIYFSNFIYLLLAVLGLCYYAQAFSSDGNQGLLSSRGVRASSS